MPTCTHCGQTFETVADLPFHGAGLCSTPKNMKTQDTNTTTGHTPTPWTSEVPCSSELTVRNIRGPNGEHVAKIGWMDYSEGLEIDLANAALIVLAVNSFQDLRDALEDFLPLATDAKCIQSVKWTSARDKARAALAKAKGQP